jgi:hypothetical protein
VVLDLYRYRVFGDPPSQRSAEDIAFSVARFFSVGGTMANYYMVVLNSNSNLFLTKKRDEISDRTDTGGFTCVNNQQYHGGTNFGRNGAAFVMPRYYDEAPLDEFGMQP